MSSTHNVVFIVHLKACSLLNSISLRIAGKETERAYLCLCTNLLL